MSKRLIILLILLNAGYSSAQVGVMHLNTFFKDRYFNNTPEMPAYKSNGFFPVSVSTYDLPKKIADTSDRKNWFSKKLFNEYLIDFKGKNFRIKATPTFDVSLGRNTLNSSEKLFQNTRGFYLQVDLMRNVTFSTSFYENQSRHTWYETNYFQSHGERYPNADGYYPDNAVIPGMTRTKPFKNGGFDYGFAFGEVNYRPHKSVWIAFGNGQRFIGDGYRSILYSDNSVVSPFLQVNYEVNTKWKITNYRSKLTNLLRRPQSATVESYYEPKMSSINYVSYQATNKWNVALFEGIIYGKGDSIKSERVDPWFYNPVPVLGALLVNKNKANAILGVNTSYQFKNIHLYGQFAVNTHNKGTGGQIGARFYPTLGKHFVLIQIEGNLTSNLYNSENPRLSYSNYNLPLAHPKGNNIQEILLRATYEYKRIFFSSKTILYRYNEYANNALLPLHIELDTQNGWQLHENIEIGYRFNPQINFSAFIGVTYNHIQTDQLKYSSNVISLGIRTGLINNNKDF